MIFLDRLLAHDRIVLSTHIRPDGDAVGSELALARLLEAHGKQVTCLNADPAPDNLAWLPGMETVKVYDESIAHRELIAHADAVVVVDTNARDRIGSVGKLLDATNATFYLVDHHTNPETWFAESFVREEASSTGELVFELFEAAGTPIDGETAQLLYTAIMTDTGSFRFSSVTPRVHRVVAELLERGGLNPSPIHAAVYENRRLGALRLLGKALGTIVLAADGQLATMTIARKLLQNSDAHSDETDGFVNYALSIEGVKAAVLLLETAHGVKLSFRSKGDTHVHEWARAFGGGGHRNASGAFVRGQPLERVHDRVVQSAADHLGVRPETPSGAEEGPLEMTAEDADLLRTMQQRGAEVRTERAKDQLRARFQNR